MNRPVRSTLWVLLVGGLALVATVAWQQWTRKPIADAEQQLQARQLLAVLPAQSYDNQPLSSPLPLPGEPPPHSRILAAYRATRGLSLIHI